MLRGDWPRTVIAPAMPMATTMTEQACRRRAIRDSIMPALMPASPAGYRVPGLETWPPARHHSPRPRGTMSAEHRRLQEDEARTKHWKRWGPYLSERAWGTVREDYSPHGTAWDYFPHDHARSRAYRWNEDGIAGISDRRQRI